MKVITKEVSGSGELIAGTRFLAYCKGWLVKAIDGKHCRIHDLQVSKCVCSVVLLLGSTYAKSATNFKLLRHFLITWQLGLFNICNVAFVVCGLVYSTEQCTGNNSRIVHNKRREHVYTWLECLEYTKTHTGS